MSLASPFIFNFSKIMNLVSARRSGVTFAQSSAKVTKSALSLCSPKKQKITAKISSGLKSGRVYIVLPRFINICLSVIFRFLLSAIHRLLTEHLCLKRLFSKDTADIYRFNKTLLVCAPLRGAVLFTDSYSDIR